MKSIMNDKKLRRGLLIVAAILICAGIAGLVMFRPVRVEIAAQAKGVPIEVYGLGSVEAKTSSNLGFETGGTLAALNADQGDKIIRGQIIARLDSTAQEARVKRAEAALAQANADRERAAAGVQKAVAIEQQKRSVDNRRQNLVARGTVSAEAAEASRADALAAAADLVLARAQLGVATAALTSTEASLALERSLLEQHTLKAPYDGVVVLRHRELGSPVTPSEAVFTVLDPQTVWVRAFVDEANAGGIRLDDHARVMLRSLPGRVFSGQVARVDIESDRANEERRVYVRCGDCPEAFHIGEQAEVVIETRNIAQAVLVPERLVFDREGGSGNVWMIENGRLMKRRIALGPRTLQGEYAIETELSASTSIVVENRPELREGRRAIPRNEAAR